MISVAIMAHPKREQWIPDLADALDIEPTVVWDERNDRWDTGRRSLLAYDPGASHHLVVQDDAIVCRDLVAGLERIAKVAGAHPVGLYMGRVRPNRPRVQRQVDQARRAKTPWVTMPGPWWGVGIMLPTDDIEAVVSFGDQRRDIGNYDRKIGRFYERRKIDCLYTAPSLVEHRHGRGNPSLIAGRTALNRRAWWFIGEDASALDVDWRTP